MVQRLVIFGASGDLAPRYLFPALIHLVEAELAQHDLSILALSRKEWSTAEYRQYVEYKLKNHAGDLKKIY